MSQQRENPTPERPAVAATDETAAIVSRIEAIERTLAAVADGQAESAHGPQIQVSEIKAVVCRYYKLRLDDLGRRSVPHYVARGRHIAIYLARRLTGKS